jgi:hypothetical protein
MKMIKPKVKKTVDNIVSKIINNEFDVYEGYDKVIYLGNSYFCYYIDKTVELKLAFISNDGGYYKVS